MPRRNMIVGGPWSGGVTATSAVIRVSVRADVTNVSMVARTDRAPSEGDDWLPPAHVWSDVQRAYKHNIYTFELKDLSPDTIYQYALITDGELPEQSRGRFTTCPLEGTRSSFKCAFASCTKWYDDYYPGYEAVTSEDRLLFFIHMGDLHYGNLHDAPMHERLARYDDALENSNQLSRLFRGCQAAYVWDDHDFLDNNMGGGAVPNLAARAQDAYRLYVPHYPIPANQAGIYQSFVVGRIAFLLLDLRYHQSVNGKTTLGTAQKNWLFNWVSRADEFDLIVLVGSFPYISDQVGKGNWGDFVDERKELATKIREAGTKKFCMLSGDAHMLAIDDGTNNTFADVGQKGFPIFHAASLASSSSTKGGPYSHGSSYKGGSPGSGEQGANQYGVMEITYPDGATPSVFWRGRRANADGTAKDLISYKF
jgi:phosphodiesterase/alkaline phosphatase D-like protein